MGQLAYGVEPGLSAVEVEPVQPARCRDLAERVTGLGGSRDSSVLPYRFVVVQGQAQHRSVEDVGDSGIGGLANILAGGRDHKFVVAIRVHVEGLKRRPEHVPGFGGPRCGARPCQ